jgi:guanosine-3',5'-bis(diphosphate) 3'-pyrophosphohydrolase
MTKSGNQDVETSTRDRGLLWQRAVSFAARAHQHQWRKDGVTPFAAHPMRVALTVACVFGERDETVLTAALLHDVIEDTTADYDDLLAEYGREVADIVAVLSKDKRLIEPERERAYDAQLAAGPWQAKLIRLADVYDNWCDAADDAAREKIRPKADRILKLAEDDERLAGAVDIVRGRV